jgi:uncharacterized protein (TIGR00730 family)
MARVHSICVFCGSRIGKDPAHKVAAEEAGRAIASNGSRLIYGGGGVGLMCVTADAALAVGGAVIGVIPQFLKSREAGHEGLDDLIVTDGMHDRKQIMFNLADAFLILPGGVGTMDETMEILTWKQLGSHSKPIVLVDLGGYWRPLIAAMTQAVDRGFMGEDTIALIDIVDTVEEGMAVIEQARAR